MERLLESGHTQIIISHSGQSSVDGQYRALPQRSKGKPTYERIDGKKPMFLFYNKKWRIGGTLGDKRASVMTLMTSRGTAPAVWQRYERAHAGKVKVECHAMTITDASLCASLGDVAAPSAKKRRTNDDGACTLMRLQTYAATEVCDCVGFRGRFRLGSTCKAARAFLFQAHPWRTVHLDEASLSDLVLQITHARKEGIAWLDTHQHPLMAVRHLYLSLWLETWQNKRQDSFKVYHLSTSLLPIHERSFSREHCE